MAKLTKEQFEKWQGMLADGWEFDYWHYLMHSGDKQVLRRIRLEDGKTLKATVSYYPVRENFREVAQQPTINLSIWAYDDSGYGHSYGLGANFKLGTQQTKKRYNILCDIANTLSDADILKMANTDTAQAKMADPFVIC